MLGMSTNAIGYFLVSLITQVLALSILPKTDGFSNLGYSVGFMALYTVAFAALARLIQSGTNLSVALPLFSATVPLATIGFGVLIYGESASPLKLGMLIAACILVGFASRY